MNIFQTILWVKDAYRQERFASGKRCIQSFCYLSSYPQIKTIVLRQFICINSLVLSYSLLTLWILLSCVVYNTTEEDNLFFDILTASCNVSHCDYNTCIARKHSVTREKAILFLNTLKLRSKIVFYSFTINDH